MNYPGMFFVFCGLDGSGKTTQAKLLTQHLERIGCITCLTSEPTSWYLNDPFVQNHLRRHELDEYDLATLALFSAADRARHLGEVILPSLNEGKVVISSRYVFSAYAYFFARGLRDQAWIEVINRYAFEPNLTFFLDVAPEVALKRITARGDTPRQEELNLLRLREVREHFLSFASNTFQIVDAHQDQDTLHHYIVSIVLPLVQRLGDEHQRIQES